MCNSRRASPFVVEVADLSAQHLEVVLHADEWSSAKDRMVLMLDEGPESVVHPAVGLFPPQLTSAASCPDRGSGRKDRRVVLIWSLAHGLLPYGISNCQPPALAHSACVQPTADADGRWIRLNNRAPATTNYRPEEDMHPPIADTSEELRANQRQVEWVLKQMLQGLAGRSRRHLWLAGSRRLIFPAVQYRAEREGRISR